MTVHFICRGNIFRSFIAEAYFNSLGLRDASSISSGTTADPLLLKNGMQIEKISRFIQGKGIALPVEHVATKLTQSRIDESDIIVCMNQRVFKECSNAVKLPSRTIIWNIDDIGEGSKIAHSHSEAVEYARQTYEEIVAKVDDLMKELRLSTASQ